MRSVGYIYLSVSLMVASCLSYSAPAYADMSNITAAARREIFQAAHAIDWNSGTTISDTTPSSQYTVPENGYVLFASAGGSSLRVRSLYVNNILVGQMVSVEGGVFGFYVCAGDNVYCEVSGSTAPFVFYRMMGQEGL